MNKCFVVVFIVFTIMTFIVSMYMFHNISIPAITKMITNKIGSELNRIQQLQVWMFVVSVVHLLCFLGIFFNLSYNIYLMRSILVPVYIVLACVYIYIMTRAQADSDSKSHDNKKTQSAIDLFFTLFIIDLFLHLIFIYSVKRSKIKKLYKPLKPFDILKIFDLKRLLK
jgi:hypothetical protein